MKLNICRFGDKCWLGGIFLEYSATHVLPRLKGAGRCCLGKRNSSVVYHPLAPAYGGRAQCAEPAEADVALHIS